MNPPPLTVPSLKTWRDIQPFWAAINITIKAMLSEKDNSVIDI